MNLCRHNQVVIDNGNSWCNNCGESTGAIFKPELYMNDEENF